MDGAEGGGAVSPTSNGSWLVTTTVSDDDARRLMAEVVGRRKTDRGVSESAILRGMIRFCLDNKQAGWTADRKVAR